MIVMPVTQYHGVGLAKINAKLCRIMPERHALASVKEHPVRAGIQPICQAMFTKYSRAPRGIFRKYGDCCNDDSEYSPEMLGHKRILPLSRVLLCHNFALALF